MRICLLLAVLLACGRIGFDAQGNGVIDAPPGDGGTPDDSGSASTDGSQASFDPQICMQSMQVFEGTMYQGDTCAGTTALDTCAAPPGTKEKVVNFTAPTSRLYKFSVSANFEIATANNQCTAASVCAETVDIVLTASQTLTFIIEASAGGCGMFIFNTE